MELLLVLIVGGIFVLLARPLKDWYVVEFHDASGASIEKSVFADADAARQAFDSALSGKARPGAARKITLWQVEARSRRAALKPKAGQEPTAVPLQSADL